MALIKILSGAGVSLHGKTIFSTSGGGGGVPTLTDTIIYDSSGNILDTVTGDVPDGWNDSSIFPAGCYAEVGTSATTIGSTAFYGNGLVSVTIANSVTTIGSHAFSYNQLTSVTIPDSVTIIGENAFYSNQLTSLTIGNSVATIGSNAFSFNQLTSVTIPDSVTTIGVNAFNNNLLTSLTIGNSVATIGSNAFYANQLASVTIPSSVTNIGYYAFGANQFTSITIPNSVTSIGDYAFGQCVLLNTVNCYAEQTAFIGSSSFYYVPGPLTIHVRTSDSTWTEQTNAPFQACNDVTIIKDLVVVNPGDTVIYDTEGIALYANTGDVPDSWKSNQNIAGYVEVGTSATSIGNRAFYFNQLTSVTIPDSVTSIGDYAFAENQTIAGTLTIPDSVTSIGIAAFQSNQLTSVVISNSVTSIATYSFSFNQLTSLTIPDSVTSIGSYSFNNNQLTSVTIPDSVTSIGNYAFAYNQLTSVTIGSSVTSTASYTFAHNPNLADVYCYTTQDAFDGSLAFYNTASPLTIHVRTTDSTWTAGTGLSFQDNNNVTIIKDL